MLVSSKQHFWAHKRLIINKLTITITGDTPARSSLNYHSVRKPVIRMLLHENELPTSEYSWWGIRAFNYWIVTLPCPLVKNMHSWILFHDSFNTLFNRTQQLHSNQLRSYRLSSSRFQTACHDRQIYIWAQLSCLLSPMKSNSACFSFQHCY